MAARTTIYYEITETTDEAVLIVVDGEEQWVPRSVCLDGDSLNVGDEDLVVENWWLRKAGIE